MGNVRVRGHDYRGKGYYFINPARWQLRQDHPRLVPVIVSTRPSETERAAQIAEVLARVERGGIPIGGFISPGEREVGAEVAKMPRARIIKLIPWGLKRYKPSGASTRWLADGRTLILTGFPDDDPEECRRANCLKNNEWVNQIAAPQSVGACENE